MLTQFREIYSQQMQDFDFNQAAPSTPFQSDSLYQIAELHGLLQQNLKQQPREAHALARDSQQDLRSSASMAASEALERMEHLFEAPFYTNCPDKVSKVQHVLRDNIDHLEINDVQLDSCLGCCTNRALGVPLHRSLNHKFKHLSKVTR